MNNEKPAETTSSPSRLERPVIRVSRLWKNWTVHNLISHPLSEVVHWVTYPFVGSRLSGWVHDITVPEAKSGEGRG